MFIHNLRVFGSNEFSSGVYNCANVVAGLASQCVIKSFNDLFNLSYKLEVMYDVHIFISFSAFLHCLLCHGISDQLST